MPAGLGLRLGQPELALAELEQAERLVALGPVAGVALLELEQQTQGFEKGEPSSVHPRRHNLQG